MGGTVSSETSPCLWSRDCHYTHSQPKAPNQEPPSVPQRQLCSQAWRAPGEVSPAVPQPSLPTPCGQICFLALQAGILAQREGLGEQPFPELGAVTHR